MKDTENMNYDIKKYGLKYLLDLGEDNDKDIIRKNIPRGIHVPVEFSSGNVNVLKNCIKSINPCNVILEIGVKNNINNNSTHTFKKEKPKNCKLFCIDIIQKHLEGLENEDNTYPLCCSSSDYTKIVNFLKEKNVDKIDLLFIDGYHSIKQILDDWKFVELLSDNGIVVLHDTNYHPPAEFIKTLDENFWKYEKHFEGQNDWGITTIRKNLSFIKNKTEVSKQDIIKNKFTKHITKKTAVMIQGSLRIPDQSIITCIENTKKQLVSQDCDYFIFSWKSDKIKNYEKYCDYLITENEPDNNFLDSINWPWTKNLENNLEHRKLLRIGEYAVCRAYQQVLNYIKDNNLEYENFLAIRNDLYIETDFDVWFKRCEENNKNYITTDCYWVPKSDYINNHLCLLSLDNAYKIFLNNEEQWRNMIKNTWNFEATFKNIINDNGLNVIKIHSDEYIIKRNPGTPGLDTNGNWVLKGK